MSKALSKPVVLQLGAYPDWDQEALDEAYDMRKLFEAEDRAAFLATHGGEVRGIATRGNLGADASVIKACPKLEIISVYGVGFDAVDLTACRARGIHVTNTPDVLTEDVADLALGMMIAARRGMIGAEAWVRSGRWGAQGPYPLQRRVHGQKAGILGLGRIGFAVGQRLAGFGMNIAYCDVAAKTYAPDWAFLPDAHALGEHADVLFVTLAATAETRHIVGRDVIHAVGPGGLIVNVSRAANVDEDALIDALTTGALGAAALDVFDGEPALDPRFLTLDNCLLQPHHASATVETRQAMGQLMRDNLAAHFAGRPLPTPVL